MKRCYNLQTCAEHSSFQRDIELCAEAGFHAVEIDFLKAEGFLREHSMEEMTEFLKKHEIVCAAVNAIFDINFCTVEKWDRICGQLDFACELCAAAGADTIIVLSDKVPPQEAAVTDQMIFGDTVSVLEKMADRIQGRKIKIAFEPVGDLLVGSVKTAWEIVKAVNRPDVGLVLDDFNLFLWDLLSDVDFIRRIPPEKIFMVHINDAEAIPFRKIDQMHRCMPGDGRIDVERYMDCVRAAGYDGYVSIEVLNPELWKKGPENIIPEAFQKLSRYVP